MDNRADNQNYSSTFFCKSRGPKHAPADGTSGMASSEYCVERPNNHDAPHRCCCGFTWGDEQISPVTPKVYCSSPHCGRPVDMSRSGGVCDNEGRPFHDICLRLYRAGIVP